MPASCPSHNWREPAVSWMSLRITNRAAFETILRTTSHTHTQTPMGQTPGHLSKAISLQDTKEDKISGDKRVVQRQRANKAIASQRPVEPE